jgi:ABC-type dipeptide/oligopeptide/nickel transport system ATPase component
LAELHRVLEIVAEGEGQVVGLVGDPGLGKSRLVWEFRRLAEDRAMVIEGRCLSYGASIAYLPLFELVRHAAGSRPVIHPAWWRPRSSCGSRHWSSTCRWRITCGMRSA